MELEKLYNMMLERRESIEKQSQSIQKETRLSEIDRTLVLISSMMKKSV
jgi:hypothetical protein